MQSETSPVFNETSYLILSCKSIKKRCLFIHCQMGEYEKLVYYLKQLDCLYNKPSINPTHRKLLTKTDPFEERIYFF